MESRSKHTNHNVKNLGFVRAWKDEAADLMRRRKMVVTAWILEFKVSNKFVIQVVYIVVNTQTTTKILIFMDNHLQLSANTDTDEDRISYI